MKFVQFVDTISRMKYTNPVVPGFYPDPSVCRVGEDYYLVTSTFEYFPGVPVFHSRDLVNWRQIGHCLTLASQLPLEKCRASGGIYAPTIRHHDGMFYMITTNVSGGGNFIVHAKDPAGEWSQPAWVDQGGIDPSLFFDDDGKVYFTGTGIVQFEIDPMTGKALSEKKVIWSGTGGRYPEGPHLYKIDGLYYLMIAEGGTEYGHFETIARSQTPWGPWEPCPHNPILSHRDCGGNSIQGTGHAELVQAHDGSWWMMHLGFRTVGGRYHHLGRETFLAPVEWTPEGWPVVFPRKSERTYCQSAMHGHALCGRKSPGCIAGTNEINVEVDHALPPHPWPVESARDDFDSPRLRLCWNFLRNPRAADGSLSARPGFLRLNGSAVTLDEADSPAFVGRRQQHVKCRAAARLDFSPGAANEEAGLTVLMNDSHHYDLAIRGGDDGRRRVLVRRRIGDLTGVVFERDIPAGPVTLEIADDNGTYTFAFALNDAPPQAVATGLARYLSSEVAGGFTGVYLGMYATGNGKPSTTPADFDWFEYHPRS